MSNLKKKKKNTKKYKKIERSREAFTEGTVRGNLHLLFNDPKLASSSSQISHCSTR